MKTSGRLPIVLALLAVAGTLASSFFSRWPDPSGTFALIVSTIAVAVCARLPLLTSRTELSLAPGLALSLLYAFGLAPAAWTVALGLLLGELVMFFAPGQPVTPARPARLSHWAAQLAGQVLPLLAAGAADAALTTTAGGADTPLALRIGVISAAYLAAYNLLLAVETAGPDGAAARFFRENRGALAVIELLPLPLLAWVAVSPAGLGTAVIILLGVVLSLLTTRLHGTSLQGLRQSHELAEARRTAEQAQQRVEQSTRQLTVVAAKLELAQHETAAHQQQMAGLQAFARIEAALREAGDSRPPFDVLIRLVSEAAAAQIGQLGLLLRGGTGFSYLASYGLSAERTAHERATVWLEEQGLAGRALRTGRPVRVGQVTADPDYLEQYPGIRSELCVPLLKGERRLGVLRLLSRQPEAFSQETEAVVVQAAGLIAYAVENLQLAEEARTRQKENAILLETGVKLTANLDIRTIYRAIVQKVTETIGADVSHLYEFDWTSGVMRLAEPRGAGQYTVKDAPCAERAVRTGQAVSVYAGAPDLAAPEAEWLTATGAAQAVIVPMLLGAQAVGAVHLYLHQAREVAPADLHIAQMLANQSAVALQNARLFHHVTEGRDRLAAILDSTREGVLVIDASGLISLINPPLEEFWGIPSHKLLNQHLLALVDQPELHITEKLGLQRDEIEELLMTLRAGLALSIAKQQFKVYAPRVRFLERTGAPVLDQFAKAIGWVVILRDVTEERELQNMRDTLANMIVHDLRSPLTSMLAGTSLIRDRLPKEQQTPLIRQSIDVAIRSGNKMLGLVNTLLDISRMESGEMALNRGRLHLAQVVDEVLGDLMPLANDQGLVLINDVPADLPGLDADREKLGRVLTNLLDNALKFSPPGGQVTVHAEAEAGEADPPAWVRVAILDSGPGIPPEYLERIFDRFVQVEGQTGRRSGTGLGLAFCKLAVEAHGGKIWVANRPEGGSLFAFTLPAGR